MIRLENVTKTYPGKEDGAVLDLTLEVPEGETCVLVGPSGCGKTTTLKMINKLLTPTSGRIYINGEDIAEVDPIELRRGIGYVIQEIGLFPHITICENIACVPSLKGWDEERKRARVNELLTLMSMDPEEFRDSYARQLSGGQRQRVGVARALGADPPILLMDEPFGAIDPITRSMLQDEFLSLQEKMRKTIVFVTHDINEAIKMGNKVAILREGRLVQHDIPEAILAAPKNEFVESFVGNDRVLKLLHLTKVEEIIMDKSPPVLRPGEALRKAREMMHEHRLDALAVVDDQMRLVGHVRLGDIEGEPAGDRLAAHRYEEKVEKVMSDTAHALAEELTLQEALSQLLEVGLSALPVVDDRGKVKGILTTEMISKTISSVKITT